MTTSKAQLRAQEKYDKDNTVQVKLKLNKKTDADIIRYLSDCDNKQGVIKALIRLEILRDNSID
jgi:hypothetical protein